MYLFSQQFTPAINTHLQTQLAIFDNFSRNLISAIQRIGALNLQAARTLIEESTANVHQLLEAKNSQDFIRITVEQIQPIPEKVQAYQQHINIIATDTNAGFAQVAADHVSKAREMKNADDQEHSYNEANTSDSSEGSHEELHQQSHQKPHQNSPMETKKAKKGTHHYESNTDRNTHASPLINTLIDNI